MEGSNTPESADRNTEKGADELSDPGHLRELLSRRKAFQVRGANGDTLLVPSKTFKKQKITNQSRMDRIAAKNRKAGRERTRGRRERKGEG